jgi:hypothetical protein
MFNAEEIADDARKLSMLAFYSTTAVSSVSFIDDIDEILDDDELLITFLQLLMKIDIFLSYCCSIF